MVHRQRSYGIADIALFAYTDVAGEGGISLEPFPEVRAWLRRGAQPRFLPMPAVTAGCARVSRRLDAHRVAPGIAGRNAATTRRCSMFAVVPDPIPTHAGAQPRRGVRRQFP